MKEEAVILHRGSFRRECGEGLGCHPSQGCWWKGSGVKDEAVILHGLRKLPQIWPCFEGQTPRQEAFGEVSFRASKRGVTRGLRFWGAFRWPWRPLGTPDGRFLGTLKAVLGHAEAVRAPPLHEKRAC